MQAHTMAEVNNANNEYAAAWGCIYAAQDAVKRHGYGSVLHRALLRQALIHAKNAEKGSPLLKGVAGTVRSMMPQTGDAADRADGMLPVWSRAMILLTQGQSDRAIAKEIGATPYQVRKWRLESVTTQAGGSSCNK